MVRKAPHTDDQPDKRRRLFIDPQGGPEQRKDNPTGAAEAALHGHALLDVFRSIVRGFWRGAPT
jgi:hypothetical protein